MAIVVQNWYFILPGREAEALAVRRAYSQVRRDAGQPVGRILLPHTVGDAVPSFIWECDYPDLAAREADAAWADSSPTLTAIRKRMGPLRTRFERVMFEVDAEP